MSARHIAHPVLRKLRNLRRTASRLQNSGESLRQKTPPARLGVADDSPMTQAPPSARPDSLSRLRAHRSAIYACGKVQGDLGKTIDAFPTGITSHRGQQLADLLRVESKRAGLTQTIETGFGLGLSALYVLEAALEASPAELVQHTVIDPFQRRDWNNAGLRMVREAGIGAH